MLNIPDKLRLWTQSVHPHLHTSRWENELGYIAASVIERLEARNARLLEALKFYADPYEFQLVLGREPTGKNSADWELVPDFYDECDFEHRAREIIATEEKEREHD